MTRIFSIICILVLTACTNTSSMYGPTPAELRLNRLEMMANRIRADHDRMGQSLGRLQSEIDKLQEEQLERKKAREARAAAAATAAKEAAEKDTASKPTILGPAPLATASAETPATSGTLTAQDLEVEPTRGPVSLTPANTSTTLATAAPAGDKVYLMQVASYQEVAQVKKGWSEIRQAHPKTMSGLSPFVTSFSDTQGRSWLRLSAGPFRSHAEASSHCNAYKQDGANCMVIMAAQGAARPLN